jgi:hypothetical protein
MDQKPLELTKIENGRDFVKSLDSLAHLKAAFWAYRPHHERWNLIVASDALDEDYLQAYEKVVSVLRKLRSEKGPVFDIDVSEIEVSSTQNPLIHVIEKRDEDRLAFSRHVFNAQKTNYSNDYYPQKYKKVVDDGFFLEDVVSYNLHKG